MKLILRTEVDNLGTRGDVVNVARGYARNFLLPKKLAVEVSEHNMRTVEKERVVHEAKVAQEKTAAEAVATKLQGVKLSFRRKVKEEGEELYGSVSVTDISEELSAKGFSLEKKQIHLAETIKTLGESTVPVKLFADVFAEIKVTVEKEED